MLERILYVSTIAPGVNDLDIQRIVAAAELRNRRLDVTGMLVYCQVHFAQVLEGRAEAIDELMTRINADSRHSDLRFFIREKTSVRLFAAWNMGALDGTPLAEEIEQIYSGEKSPDSLMQRLLLQVKRRTI